MLAFDMTQLVSIWTRTGLFPDGIVETLLGLLTKIIENMSLHLTVKFVVIDININVHFHVKCMLLIYHLCNFLALLTSF